MIVDYVTLWREATEAIVDADTEMRALFQRTQSLCVPWSDGAVDGPMPVVVYFPITHTPAWEGTSRLRAQFAAFGDSEATVNAAIKRVVDLLKAPAYTARGLSAALDNESQAVRTWPDAGSTPDEVALARADVEITFLIPD